MNFYIQYFLDGRVRKEKFIEQSKLFYQPEKDYQFLSVGFINTKYNRIYQH